MLEVAEALKPLVSGLAWRDEWANRASDAFVKPGSTRSLLGVLQDDEAEAAPAFFATLGALLDAWPATDSSAAAAVRPLSGAAERWALATTQGA